MTSDTPSPLVPKLRFPEFRSRPGWPFTTLSAVMEEHGVKSDGASEVHSVSLAKGIVPQIEHMGRSFAANDTARYSLVRPFDVVYTRSPLAIFKLGIVKQHKEVHNAIVSPLYGVFTPRNRHLGLIVEAYFNSPSRSIQFLAPLAQKGAKNTIQLSNDRFLSGALHLPKDEDEQQKIADCLRSLDDLIAAEGRKLEAQRRHKQGLMQQLFPQPGETIPRLRFPEFRDAKAWRLSSIAELVEAGCLYAPRDGNHGNLHPKASDYVSDGIPFVMASDLKAGLIDTSSCCFISKELADSLKKGFARKGDVLLSHKGTVGEVAVVREIKTPYLMLTPQVTYYRVKDENKLSNEFLAQSFMSDFFQTNLVAASGGGTRSYIGITEQAKLCLFLPTDMTEQQRIASFLTNLDSLINAQSKKFETLEKHKRGLLQQLFTPEEKSR